MPEAVCVSADLGSITTLVPNGLIIVIVFLKLSKNRPAFLQDGSISINARANARRTDNLADCALIPIFTV